MQVSTKNIVWSNYLSAPLAQFLLNQNSRGTAVGSRPSTRPSPRSRCPRTCEPPARRPRAPARMSSRLTGGRRLRGMHDGWPWGPSRRSWRLGAVLPRRNHPGSREDPPGAPTRSKLRSLSSGHIVYCGKATCTSSMSFWQFLIASSSLSQATDLFLRKSLILLSSLSMASTLGWKASDLFRSPCRAFAH